MDIATTHPLAHKLKRIQEQEKFRKDHTKNFESLTNREREVLKLIVQDNNNRKVADKLFISRTTVEQHRKNINRKLKTSTFRQLFQYALAFDLD